MINQVRLCPQRHESGPGVAHVMNLVMGGSPRDDSGGGFPPRDYSHARYLHVVTFALYDCLPIQFLVFYFYRHRYLHGNYIVLLSIPYTFIHELKTRGVTMYGLPRSSFVINYKLIS